jgi:hypothetical protein
MVFDFKLLKYHRILLVSPVTASGTYRLYKTTHSPCTGGAHPLASLAYTTTLEGVTQRARPPGQVSHLMRNLNADWARRNVHL